MKTKIVAVVDTAQQAKEKNISWEDYPMFNKNTGRKLKGLCIDYYDTWEGYISLFPEKEYRENYLKVPGKIQAQSTARTQKSRVKKEQEGLKAASFLLPKEIHQAIGECQEKHGFKNRSEALIFMLD